MSPQFKVVAVDKHGKEHSPFKSTLPFSVAIKAVWRWHSVPFQQTYTLKLKPV